jgi:hypothetical protein
VTEASVSFAGNLAEEVQDPLRRALYCLALGHRYRDHR